MPKRIAPIQLAFFVALCLSQGSASAGMVLAGNYLNPPKEAEAPKTRHASTTTAVP